MALFLNSKSKSHLDPIHYTDFKFELDDINKQLQVIFHNKRYIVRDFIFDNLTKCPDSKGYKIEFDWINYMLISPKTDLDLNIRLSMLEFYGPSWEKSLSNWKREYVWWFDIWKSNYGWYWKGSIIDVNQNIHDDSDSVTLVVWKIYFKPEILIHQEGYPIPQDRPYNKMTSDWREVTFMTGNASKILLWDELIKFKNWQEAYPAFCKRLKINTDKVMHICDSSKENWDIIKLIFKKQNSAGTQDPNGNTSDEGLFYCWTNIEIDEKLVCVKVDLQGNGKFLQGNQDYGWFMMKIF